MRAVILRLVHRLRTSSRVQKTTGQDQLLRAQIVVASLCHQLAAGHALPEEPPEIQDVLVGLIGKCPSKRQ